jgi:type II secretory ATPase GspE/PulE/Tfp pilus assembly ATPase PilB-like protein
MVLVTGRRGSGKTATLYAALNEIKSGEDKIITIETRSSTDPRDHPDSGE